MELSVIGFYPHVNSRTDCRGDEYGNQNLSIRIRIHHRVVHAVAEAVAIKPGFGCLTVWVCTEELVGALVEDTTAHVDEPELRQVLMHTVTTSEAGWLVGHNVLAPVRRVAAHSPWLVGELLNFAGSDIHQRCEGVLTVGHRSEQGVLPRCLDIDGRQAVTAVKIVNFAIRLVGIDIFLGIIPNRESQWA